MLEKGSGRIKETGRGGRWFGTPQAHITMGKPVKSATISTS